MPEYSDYQKKLIGRYYDRRDGIMLTRLQELVTELYLADTPRKQDQLWERARKAMTNLKVKPGLIEHLLDRRDVSLLARNVQNWMKAAAAEGH